MGIASSENWSEENPTKRYEASAGIHKSGDVPLHIIPENEWTIIEMPLSAFVDKLGDELTGISISVAQGAIYIDYIVVEEGLVLDFNFEAWAQVENTSICIELTAADII